MKEQKKSYQKPRMLASICCQASKSACGFGYSTCGKLVYAR